MADATLAFNILTKYKDRGADKAAKDFDKLDKSARRTGGSLKRVAAAGAVAAGAGFFYAGKALVSFTQNAIADEAAQRKMAVGIRNATNATDGQIKSVERWIAKQGVALGVTDDELRPAFQRLVQATGDIGKAQKLAAVAMDASAGSGKSLKTVTEAIAKAQNGNMGSLSRLGVAIKNAKGETLTFDQAMRGMAKTFKGQAEARASTLEGKMDRLKLIIDETKEAIGARMIPVATKLADIMLNDVGPGVSKTTGFLGQHKTALKVAGVAVGILTAGVLTYGAASGIATAATKTATVAHGLWIAAVKVATIHQTIHTLAVKASTTTTGTWLGVKRLELAAWTTSTVSKAKDTAATLIHTAAEKASAVASKAMAAGQWALNVALSANPIGLVIVGLVALAAATVVAYKKSETFRKIVHGAWAIIGTAARLYWNTYLKPAFTMLKTAWEVGGKAARGMKDGTVKAWQGIKSITTSSVRWVVDKVLWMAEKTLDGAVAAFGWAPKVGDQLKKARDKVRDFREQVAGELKRIPDEGVNVSVKGFWKAPKNVAMNKLLGHFARGGPIRGPGGGTDDKVPILASNNEHMLTADDVKKAGGHKGVYAIRKMLQRGTWPRFGDVPRYASGGPVFSQRTSLGAIRAPAERFASRAMGVMARAMQSKLRELWKALGGAGQLTPGQISRGQRFARSQVGDPYVWGGVGPNGYDCSGFISAVLNAAQGRNPYSRRGTTSTMPWPGFSEGPGSFSVGWFRGSPGHMAGRIGGLGIESAGGVGVRVGGAARGLGSFPNVAHYDEGGMLRPGWTLAYNGTGRPEPVIAGGGDTFLGTIRVVLEYPDGRKAHQQLLKVRRELRRPLGLE